MLSLPGIFLVLIVALVIIQYMKLRWTARTLPPGPTPFPVIGNLWQMNFEFYHENLITLAKLHGNILTVWVGPIPMIILSGCQAVKEGLTAHPDDVSGRPKSPFYSKLGNEKGIIFTSGHPWKLQRRIGAMGLKNLGLGKKGLEYQIQEEAHHLSEVFANSKGQPLDPSFHIVLAVSNVICAVVFGHRFSKDDETFHHLIESAGVIMRTGGSIWQNLYDMFPGIMERLPGPHKKVFACADFLHSFARTEIRSHEESWSLDHPRDFIDFYLAQMAKSKDGPASTVDESNLIQSILDFFLAGTETTATTLRWALLYMVAYPDIQGKVQRELDDVLGSSSGLISYDHRKKLPYTNAVIHEIQRYANIVAVGVPRESTKDTTLLGFPIKKGTIIIPNLSSTLLDSKEWETPRHFNPGHFLDKEGNFVNREAFLAFSTGPRSCLGEQLARIELFIFFTSLLREFTFQLPEGVKEVNKEYIKGLTLLPHPHELCVFPR